MFLMVSVSVNLTLFLGDVLVMKIKSNVSHCNAKNLNGLK